MFEAKKIMTKEAICSFALGKIFKYEPRLANEAVEIFGGAAELLGLGPEGIMESLGPYNKYAQKIASVNIIQEAERLEQIEKQGFRYLCHDNSAFPEPLRMCEDAPLGFFVRSEDSFENIFSQDFIAIVGTRDASSYGTAWTEKVVGELAGVESRPCIVSGLAYGIDICAHKAALNSSLTSIAVLGTGIDTIYPSRHEYWADRLIHTPGCAVISEHPPGAEVLGINFLSRNRIIAGLGRATLLMESRVKGGGMTTARVAESYGRSVLALPGRIDDPRSQGCNQLISSRIADPISDCNQLLKALGYKKRGHKSKGQRTPPDFDFESASANCNSASANCNSAFAGFNPNLAGFDPDSAGFKSEDIRILLETIRLCRDLNAEQLARECGFAYKDVAALLPLLESEGLIRVDLLGRASIV